MVYSEVSTMTEFPLWKEVEINIIIHLCNKIYQVPPIGQSLIRSGGISKIDMMYLLIDPAFSLRIKQKVKKKTPITSS